VIGIVVAMPEELEAFRPWMMTEIRSAAGMRIAACHIGEHLAHVILSGCGKVAASMAAVHLLRVQAVDILLNVGTAGYLPKGQDTPEAHFIVEAAQHDYGAYNPAGFTTYNPGDLPLEGSPRFTPYRVHSGIITRMVSTIDGLKCSKIISGDAFLGDPLRAHILQRQHRAQLVDMECAAIAQVATAYSVPWFGVKATTDSADNESPDSFSKNLIATAQRAAHLAARLIQTLTNTYEIT
jgi:adenosylhomocysteine nucleosidase